MNNKKYISRIQSNLLRNTEYLITADRAAIFLLVSESNYLKQDGASHCARNGRHPGIVVIKKSGLLPVSLPCSLT